LQQIDPHVDEALRTAIQQRRLLRLIYQGKERVVEPHDYGVQNASPKLLAYQIGGSSSGRLPNWRWLHVELISEVYLLDRTFPGGRRIPSGKHHVWDKVFVRVQQADQPVEATEPDCDSARLAKEVAALGYPGFRHLRKGPKSDPADVLLFAVSSDDPEIRIIEALPWIAVHYFQLDWERLIDQAVQRQVQNRLGFIVTLARRTAEKQGPHEAARSLSRVEDAIRRKRLDYGDTSWPSSLAEAELSWLRHSRTNDAADWNLLTGVNFEHLSYAT
jgi:hypothetical protein